MAHSLKWSPSGGRTVKASTLVVGDYIRDPRRSNRILIVKEVGSNIFAQGLDSVDSSKHLFIDQNTFVDKVTGAE